MQATQNQLMTYSNSATTAVFTLAAVPAEIEYAIQTTHTPPQNLRLDSVVAELYLYEANLDISEYGVELELAFSDHVLPGVILTEGDRFVCMISRQRYLEIMNTPYGRDLYVNRPLKSLYNAIADENEVLVIFGNMTIEAGVSQCLQRRPDLMSEPVVVILEYGSYRILDSKDLLLAYMKIHELAISMLKHQNARMSAELQVTRKLQQMVLPTLAELQQVLPLDIAAYMKPADEVGGDYYDVLHLGNRIKIAIGDVTGHGLESGVIMLMVQTAVRTLFTSEETDPVAFLSHLNRAIYANAKRMKTDKMLTLSILDYENGKITLSGQHEEAIIARKNGDIERIDTCELGFFVGMEPEIRDHIKQYEIHLAPGDGMVLYTDGITEAFNASKKMYGIERLCEVIRAHWDQPAEAIKQEVIEDINGYIGTTDLVDDITLVVLKQK